MTFSDIFKSSFLEKTSEYSLSDIVLALLLSFAVGLFIFVIYKKTFKGVMYSASFGVSIMAMTLITTLVILAVTSNIVLSLGMVGALSIVRFRTAVKDPMDIVFLFWAISAGIVVGAGLILLAAVSSIIIGIILVLFINKRSIDVPYIIVLDVENNKAETDAVSLIRSRTKKALIKSKTVSENGIELTMEVRLLDMSAGFLNELLTVNGVSNASHVSYNGDYTS